MSLPNERIECPAVARAVVVEVFITVVTGVSLTSLISFSSSYAAVGDYGTVVHDSSLSFAMSDECPTTARFAYANGVINAVAHLSQT